MFVASRVWVASGSSMKFGWVALMLVAIAGIARDARAGATLSPGDIVFSVRENNASSVQLLDPSAGGGTATSLSSGGVFTFISDVAVPPGGGSIYVTDLSAGLVR